MASFPDGEEKEKLLARPELAAMGADAKITAAEKALAASRPMLRREGPGQLPRRPRRAKPAPVKPRHAEAFRPNGRQCPQQAKKNFLALIFCLMVGRGAAAHPDALLHHAFGEEARVSVFWSLFFIFLLYFTAPALAILAKYDGLTSSSVRSSPNCRTWVSNWAGRTRR